MEEKMKMNSNVVEKEIHPMPGMAMLLLIILASLASFGLFIVGAMFNPILVVAGVVLFTIAMISIAGLKVVNPNEALVLTLFGKYYGTIKSAGFYFVNPFVTAFNPGAEKVVTKNADGNVYVKTVGSKKVSTKVCTLNNEKQKVNDVLGNPIIIGAVVIWMVTNPTQAVFAVENYRDYLSIECDSTIRNIARLYP